MRGYVEAQEAAHKFGYSALNETERALIARPEPSPREEAEEE